jgi:anti-sigma-K factor RskA
VTAPPGELALLADEYVLGLLDPSEIDAFEAHLASDPDLRSAVAAARERVLEFDLSENTIEPSPHLWPRIEATISRPLTRRQEGEERAQVAPDRPGAGEEASAATPTTPRAIPDRALEGHRSTRRWRAAAITGLAASVLLAVALGWQIMTAPQPVVIAVLLDEEGEPVALVEDYGDALARVIPLADIDVPEGRALEVWTLPDPDAGPVSVGLLQRNRATTIEGPDLPPPNPDQLYEITLERETGSPTGGPTGPIVGKGFARVPR